MRLFVTLAFGFAYSSPRLPGAKNVDLEFLQLNLIFIYHLNAEWAMEEKKSSSWQKPCCSSLLKMVLQWVIIYAKLSPSISFQLKVSGAFEPPTALHHTSLAGKSNFAIEFSTFFVIYENRFGTNQPCGVMAVVGAWVQLVWSICATFPRHASHGCHIGFWCRFYCFWLHSRRKVQ